MNLELRFKFKIDEDLSTTSNNDIISAGNLFNQINEKNNKQNELIWYQLPSGKIPAKEFYEKSSEDIQLSFDRLFDRLLNNTLSQAKNSSKLLDSKERIFELRVKDQNHWARITYSRVDGDSILLLGFNKDQNQTPKIEIEKSIKYKKDYINRGKGEKVNAL